MKDIRWAAGFLEGEGHFRLRKYGQHTTPEVTASQKDLEPLRRLIKAFGVGKIYNYDKARGVSCWRVCGKPAQQIMKAVFPEMSKRRKKQIRPALAHKIRGVGRPRSI